MLILKADLPSLEVYYIFLSLKLFLLKISNWKWYTLVGILRSLLKSLTEYIIQIFLCSEAIMIPTYHADNNGRLILLFVIPMLGEKICFCIIENWKVNDGLDYLLI